MRVQVHGRPIRRLWVQRDGPEKVRHVLPTGRTIRRNSVVLVAFAPLNSRPRLTVLVSVAPVGLRS